MGAGAARLQLATYPQSPFSGPAHCCDVTDLYQAFSQGTGPGRLWISLDSGLLVCFPLSIDRTSKKLGQKKPTKKTQNYNLDLSSQRGHATWPANARAHAALGDHFVLSP